MTWPEHIGKVNEIVVLSHLHNQLYRVRQSLIRCERDMRRLPGSKDAKIHYRCLKAEEKSLLKALGHGNEIAEDRLRQCEMQLK